jgi:putative transposase
VRELAGSGVPVTVACRVLKLSRQPYDRWLAAPITTSEVVEAYRANALFDAHRTIRSSVTGSWRTRPATLGRQ